MTEGNRIVSYSNGIKSFYDYLSFYMGEQYANPNLIKYNENIVNAKVSFLALFLILEKEDMVEKEDNNFSSKIIDQELAKSIELIAEKDGDTYKIGEYEDKNPANIIALIRNKFAHGDYIIEASERKIIINSNSKKLELDIDKMIDLVAKSFNNLIVMPKCNAVSRIQVMNSSFSKTNLKYISNKEDAVKALKFSRLYEFKLFSIDGSEIDRETMMEFDGILAMIRKMSKDESEFKANVEKARTYFYNKKYVLDTKKKKMSLDDINDVIKLAESMNIYNIPTLPAQIHILATKTIKKLNPNYENNDLLTGLISNLELLDKMDRYKNFDLLELWGQNSLSYFNVMDECLVSGLAAHFCALYVYPLENVYLDKMKYSLDRFEQLDFSKLRLEYIKPKKLTIYDAPLKQIELEYNGKLKEISEVQKNLEKEKRSLKIVKEKGNAKAILTLENSIKRISETLINLCHEFILLEEKYNKMKADYKVNSKYFENRAIIEGIRNAIAHGNICIKRFENIKDIDDMIINFKDIYNGEILFDLDVTIRDFETLFLYDNIKPIIDFLNKKGNDSLSTCEPLKFPMKKIAK